MSRLLEPLSFGALSLKNRLVMPPMATAKADTGGRITSDLLAYYAEKAASGEIGLVITEHCFVHPQGRNRVGQPSVADDSMLDGLGRLAETLHSAGSRAVVQINHAGGACSSEVTGLDVIAPSAVPSPVGPGQTPRPMTAEEIAAVVTRFADAARRVREAGFDGVEIHAAHGYLLNQFFSLITNRRTDEYGGDLPGRIRVHLMVIAAVREAVGPDFPLLLRLGARDYLEGGTSIADSVEAAVEFERAGVDVLDITGGLTGYLRPGHAEPGYFAELSRPIKDAVALPIILTGGVTEGRHAEELLACGDADLVGVGRAILKDSAWPARAIAELRSV